jgi:tetratricopeptide (TPR) repeat protein
VSLLWVFPLLLPAARQVAEPSQAPSTIAVTTADGELWCSIQARDVPLRELLAGISAKGGGSFDGLGSVEGEARVTAALTDLPLSEALLSILGSVGMRADRAEVAGNPAELAPARWSVHPILAPGSLPGSRSGSKEAQAPPTVSQLQELALAAYSHTVRRWPATSQAAEARLSQALVELARGNDEAAARHCDALVDTATGALPESALLPAALSCAGGYYERRADWPRAVERFSELVARERTGKVDASARLSLARCVAHLGDGARALAMLDALGDASPPRGAEESVERTLVRVLALIDLGRDAEALDLLETLADTPRSSSGEARHLRMLELRASCLERLGELAPAARALLTLSQSQTGEVRGRTLERAARLALESGDDLAVLFIARMGAPESAALAETSARARAELGLEPAQAPRNEGPRPNLDGVARATLLCERGRCDDALALLEPLLSDPRAQVAKARCLERRGRSAEALEIYRGLVEGQPESDAGLRAAEHVDFLTWCAGFQARLSVEGGQP